nr:hypothetical protein [Salinivirgaceae bacterium]
MFNKICILILIFIEVYQTNAQSNLDSISKDIRKDIQVFQISNQKKYLHAFISKKLYEFDSKSDAEYNPKDLYSYYLYI